MTKKKLSQSCIFSGISEFKLSLEFALTFNPSLPKRKSEKVPEKPLFLCFLKGSGEEETRKEKDEEEKKPRAIRWPEKGKRGGEKHTQRGPDFYLSFLPPQEKLKSAGRKD